MTKIIKSDSYTQNKALGLEESAPPTKTTDTGFVYTGDVAANTELYYRDSAGNDVQITSGGGLNVPPVDATKLVNGTAEVTLTHDSPEIIFTNPAEIGHLRLTYNSVLLGLNAGDANTAVGTVAIGEEAGKANTVETANTFIGYQAGNISDAASAQAFTTIGNTYLGYHAGYNSLSINSIAIGENALSGSTSLDPSINAYCNGNIAIGKDTMSHIVAGTYDDVTENNIAIGTNALHSLVDASNNVVVGANSGTSVTEGGSNVIVGPNSGTGIQSGSANVIIGMSTGMSLVTKSSNVFIGSGAGLSADANNCVGIGANAGSGFLADGNVAIGKSAGYTGSAQTGRTFIGHNAGNGSTGANNTVIGYNAADAASFTGIDNTVIGYDALGKANGAANYNTVIGSGAGSNITEGDNNTVVGYAAGYSFSTGANNTLIGYGAGSNITAAGGSNVVVGCGAMGTANGALTNATAVGFEAGKVNTASGTVAVGYQAGKANTLSTGNTFFGYQAGIVSTKADNTIIGYQAGVLLDGAYGGTGNTFIGARSADAVKEGEDNVIIGRDAGGQLNGNSSYNVIIGAGAAAGFAGDGDKLIAIGPGACNAGMAAYGIAIGYNAGYASTNNNIFIGKQAGYTYTSAAGNIGIGDDCLSGAASSGFYNTAIGYQAGDNITSGGYNCLLGYFAGSGLTSGSGNVCVGERTGFTSTTTANSVLVGHEAGYSNNVAESVFVGVSAGKYNSTGTRNTYVGSYSGSGVGGTEITGADNAALGYQAGYALITTANSNTLLGSKSGIAVTTGSNNILLGYNSGSSITTGADNIIIGAPTGAAASARTFKVGYHASYTPMFSGVMYDGVSGTDSALTIGAQDFRVYDPVTSSGVRSLIVKDGKLSTNNESSPDVNVGGLCLYSSESSSKNHETFKASGVAHGCTTAFGETDTFAQFGRTSDSHGTLHISGINDDSSAAPGILMTAVAGVADAVDGDTKDASTASTGVFQINTLKISGTGVTSWGGGDIIMVVRNNDATQFAITGAGSIQGNAAYVEYDDEDDIKLVQSFSDRKANPYYDRLSDLGIISKGGMCDMQKMDMLSIGAIGQLFNIIRALAVKLGVSEDELYALAKQY